MKRYALDANAIITYLEDRAGADKVERLIESCQRREIELLVSSINVGEAFYLLWKHHGEQSASQRIQGFLQLPVLTLDANLNRSLKAAEIKAKYHTGYGDSFLAEVAFDKKATVVTADPDFKRFGDKLKVLWLPSHKAVN